MLSKRVEILLEPAEMEALRRQAKESKKSIGALIRDAVKEKYLTPTPETRAAALRRLLSSKREVSFPSWMKLKKELDRGMRR
ncbi:MAG: ribbon-helix-helix protein, CopG family [Deltaproteobacteria bacterium]|nr:ribbon-helix-helix protein, CopG family [Deltaproteobacteria bacterium]MCH7915072.1 ribbon-helix-helix protein, CopG family [Deltaproteobacteria bacterium]MCZ6450148.1 ribbon-helix-helix protein, CopG family [Deltaproteobacteria bacterium]MCZ6548582.1 ribbon-helix-helix protein, CopG family [Deltaproteobacteria bacterium]MCZ6620674.1 ribbon-helix-helix protein, CopG family [Deltaproteobacteria bacterium]